jgi:hypothetical protein
VSDGGVVSLADRRPKRAAKISGSAIVPNDALHIPFSKVASHEVQWAFRAACQLEGDKSGALQGTFLAAAFDENEPMGDICATENGLSAQFVVGTDFAALITGAALSPVPFEVLLQFQADEAGVVRDLRLSIQRKQAV